MRSSRENEQSSGRKTLRVFVDANTIISGLVFEGNEALLMKLGAVGACNLVTTQYVMEEVSRSLVTKEFRLNREEVQSLLSFTNKCVAVYESVSGADLQPYSGKLNDQKDLHILAGFEKLDCDALVTGDRELLEKIAKARTTRQLLKILLGEP
jgi:predicted nucleic acid-binding protein